MSLHRREFLKLSSATLAGLPLNKLTRNGSWYKEAGDELYAAFSDPANTARPFGRWWWNGLLLVKEELVRELDLLRSIGIGGVEIHSIRFPDTADPLTISAIRTSSFLLRNSM